MKSIVSDKERKELLDECNQLLAAFSIVFDIELVCGTIRQAELCFHRALIVLILRNQGISTVRIGGILNRDHSSVINLSKYGNRKQSIDPRYNEVIDKLQSSTMTLIIKKEIQLYEKRIELLKYKLSVAEAQPS